MIIAIILAIGFCNRLLPAYHLQSATCAGWPPFLRRGTFLPAGSRCTYSGQVNLPICTMLTHRRWFVQDQIFWACRARQARIQSPGLILCKPASGIGCSADQHVPNLPTDQLINCCCYCPVMEPIFKPRSGTLQTVWCERFRKASSGLARDTS